MKVDKKLKAKWVTALRSGKYTQGKGVLKDCNGSYCCLGVLCHVAGKRIPAHTMNLDNSPSLRKLRDSLSLGVEIDGNKQCELTVMNDDKNRSFKQIADWIEKNV